MKNLLISLLLLLCTVTHCLDALGQSAIRQTDSLFLNSVIREDWQSAERTLAVQLKQQLPRAGLKDVFTKVFAQVGKLTSFDTTASPSRSIQLYICRFSKESAVMQIASNDSAKIIGFFFRPLEQLYKLPSYAVPGRYQEIPVNVFNREIKLPGMITTPKTDDKKRVPIVIFVGGSGPSDKDETMGVDKPFKDIAIGLATNGVASIRFDKRSYAHQELFKTKDYTLYDEYFDDVSAAIHTVKAISGIDTTQIYIAGHSLGGMLAPQILTLHPEVKGAVLLEANARPIYEILYNQVLHVDSLNHEKMPKAELIKLKADLNSIKSVTKADSSRMYMNIKGSYWYALNHYYPLQVARTLRSKRLLIVQGGRDYQVTMTEFNIWKTALRKYANVSFKEFPMLNHALTQSDNSLSPEEYNLPQNVPLQVSEFIAQWILENRPN